MSVDHVVLADRYRDSVTLLAFAARLRAEPGIDDASVVMATVANLELVASAGFTVPADARPSDLLVSIRGDDDACAAVLTRVADLLDERPVSAGDAVARTVAPRSVRAAIESVDSPALALISVPGAFAAAEAAKALTHGAHVMVFSDNVTVDDEIALKTYAAAHGLLFMGPDCGTAIIDGVPLGFANAVRRGSVAVIGASGTGMQEVVSIVHRLGGGIAWAIGTGGRDLSDAVGGIAMLHAIDVAADDPDVEVLLLVSKPPSVAVLHKLIGRIAAHRARGALAIPIVTALIGADPIPLTAAGLIALPTLAGAAAHAVSLLRERAPIDPLDATLAAPSDPAAIDHASARTTHGRRCLRAAFCGGTFAYEAQLVWRRHGLTVASNGPTADNPHLAFAPGSRWPDTHCAMDFGADELTVGRPHPMIDPSWRDEALARAWRDPATAVVMFDVVLGYGGAADPIARLCALLDERADATIDRVVTIAHVCGTAGDPQDRQRIVAALTTRGAEVAISNADAATRAAHALGARADGGWR